MNHAARALLEKANRSVQAARTLLAEGHPDFAIARAYYAMFYAAEALLTSKGLRFRKHGSVHAAFGEHFVRTGVIDAKFHRWLLDAFDQRIVGDYGVDGAVDEEAARQAIAQAEEFLNEARRHPGF